ncbi:hypothetical protein SNE40_011617 [Patella caerulea]|uniref:ADP-dependent glucokinase n=1 Tax=Patella caerulea TaxID=87958 RepID=A0AAN8PIY9_PATCE
MIKSVSCGALVIIIAVFYYRWQSTVTTTANLTLIEKNVIFAWDKHIKFPSSSFQRLSVGVNSNLDIIVDGVKLLKKLGISPGKQKNHDIIDNLEELQETFSYFFDKGSAAERIFSEPSIYKQITNAAKTLPGVEYYIGGNAALMATKASVLFPDVEIQFVGPIGPKLAQMMPKSINIPKNSHISEDELHLIMEYKVGQSWGDSTAPVATRFITSYDESNSKVTMLERYFEDLKDFQPDLALISGLHLLDGETQEFFTKRIDSFISGLRSIPRTVPVHLELASMANKEFVKNILNKVLPEITSLGLNEQELVFSAYAAGGPHGEDYENHNGQPIIHRVADIMSWLLTTYGYSKNNPNSRLTRIHFHSLTYHIAGVHPDVWGNVESATMAGARVAGLQACDVTQLDPNIIDLHIPLKYNLFSGDIERSFNSSHPLHRWKLNGHEFVFSPVLVCKKPLKTVGLGDAISATGLMYSKFTFPVS